jgi:hypothetical protein
MDPYRLGPAPPAIFYNVTIPSVPQICTRDEKATSFGRRPLSLSIDLQPPFSIVYVTGYKGVMSKSSSLTNNTPTTMSKFHFSSVHLDAENQRGALPSGQPL